MRASRGRPAAPPEREPPPEIVPRPRPRVDSRTIEIEHFVPRAQIHPRYFDKPYFIVPRDAVGQEAFAVIREAMRGKEMVGIGRVVLSARERPIALEPLGQGLCGMTLHSRSEIPETDDYFAEIPEITLHDEMLRVAEHILETKAADFDLSMLEDPYQNALVQMLRQKQADMPMPLVPTAPSPQNVINLMDALRRSAEAERRSRESPPTRQAAATPKRAPPQRGSIRTRRIR
jgi:Ku protein